MFSNLRLRRKKRKGNGVEIYPDEVMLDARNLPQFDRNQFEGRIEHPISRRVIAIAGGIFFIIGLIFLGKIWGLQVSQGEAFTIKSENNRLRHTVLFAERGVIYDREGKILSYNEPPEEGDEFAHRGYTDTGGLSHILGYVKYPSKDSAGFYYKEDFEGVAGAELFFNDTLDGNNGLKIIETNALGQISSESTIEPPKDGENVTLSIDAEMQSELYLIIKDAMERANFDGGAGIVMDIETGEIIAMTSVPEYDSKILTEGKDREAISGFLTSPEKPFLNRALNGLYTPGSTVKPYMAIAALDMDIINPEKNILSTGSISIPNPYNPDMPTVFKDWKAHGLVDMRRAIAVSSNVYFYVIGGGYEDQKGLGISNIDKYMDMFGFGSPIPYTDWLAGPAGVVPDPEWKKENFNGDSWRIGDTYHTSIGQYGFQITPLQAVRAAGAIASSGNLVTPTLLKQEGEKKPDSIKIDLKEKDFQIVREGMRDAVLTGFVRGLLIPGVSVAAKTGTAELGVRKEYINAWVVGFFPYENPKYSFVVLMERGPVNTQIGGVHVSRQFLLWMAENRPEYLK